MTSAEEIWLYTTANKYKDQTGLPVNILVDECAGYERNKCCKRIFFQLNHGCKLGQQPRAAMDLEGNVIWETYDEGVSEISPDDIEAVSNFVRNNRYALDKIADEDIHMYDFDKVMIKGGNPATEEEITKQRELTDKFVETRK